ncbi:hypothetical protein IV203_033428 [Nitzschia inconspicua]|uniref:Uncharacterized protein n=1 Tax=Nitzschia inconspicua TaxID=303405 RepID=A0A9K3K5D7_9STRA|nr:hypothetical protein IV203_033428 [Nitzschia inconspicua]
MTATVATTNTSTSSNTNPAADLKVHQKWTTATLPFHGFVCMPTDDVSTTMMMASFQERHDLFSLTQTMCKGFILRFDPETFPVVPGGGGVVKNKDSIKKLFDVLKKNMLSINNNNMSVLTVN